MLWPVAENDDTSIPGIDRLLALTDGVVAIALTLLVLQLQIPGSTMLANDNSVKDLWRALNPDLGELTSYLVSFVIIAQFWLVHHRAMRNMRGHSEGLAWRNFGFLLALTLMPFSSDLIGRFGSNPLAITLFSLNLAFLTVSTQWIMLYAFSHNLVEEEHRSPHDELAARMRGGVVLVIIGISIVFAWSNMAADARYVWLLFLVAPFISARLTGLVERSRSAKETSTS
jgi:uncharacterized membrane protein